MAFRNLTNVGKEYLATRLANELPVKFIKAKIGNGSVPLLVNPADTKDLYNFKKEVTIIEAVQEQNSIKLTLQVTNNEILEGFYLKEIGIYVDDNGKEVLYWYCNEDNSQYINAQTDVPLSFEIDIMMEVTNINSTVIEWAGKENWISKNYFDEKVRTFEIPTIAELQSRKNLKVGDIVEVLGYYTAGDGAGHKRIIANEDDGSGVLLNNGLYANIVHNGEVNVGWFGAKGDGVTDDTDIIQKAVNYSNLIGIKINFNTNDKYYITKEIALSNGVDFNNCTIVIKQTSNNSFGRLVFSKNNQIISSLDKNLEPEQVNAGNFSVIKKYGKCLLVLNSNDIFLIRMNHNIPIYKSECIYLDEFGNSYHQLFNDYTSFKRIRIYLIDEIIKTVENLNIEVTLFDDGTTKWCYPIIDFNCFHNSNLKNINIKVTNNDVARNPQQLINATNCYNFNLINVVCSPLLSREYSGTYCFGAENVVGLTFDNVIFNSNSNDCVWGAAGTNSIKNWNVKNSDVNRIDVHSFGCGNLTVLDSNIESINLSGKQNLMCDNSRIGTISFRPDYNNHFYGDINIKRCALYKKYIIDYSCYDNFDSNMTRIKSINISDCKFVAKEPQFLFALTNISSEKSYPLPEVIKINNSKSDKNTFSLLFKKNTITSESVNDEINIFVNDSKLRITTYDDVNSNPIIKVKTNVNYNNISNLDIDTSYIEIMNVNCEDCIIDSINNFEGNVNTTSYLSFLNCKLLPNKIVGNTPKTSFQISEKAYLKFTNCLFGLPQDLVPENYSVYKDGSLIFFNNSKSMNFNVEFENCNYTKEAINYFEEHKNQPEYSALISDLYTSANAFTKFSLRWFSKNIYDQIVGTIQQLDSSTYYREKMKQDGVYNDFIAYMDEKTLYDKQQRKLEEQRKLAYQEALKENPNLSYEEFMSVQPMTLNLVEEPQPSKALKQFMEKYL